MSILVQIVANIGGRSSSIRLLLAGTALSSVCSSISNFIVYIADDREGIPDFHSKVRAMKRFLCLILCAPSALALSFTDANGRSVEVAEHPQRVVSLCNSYGDA